MTLFEYLSAPPRFLPASENQVGIVENEAYLSLLYKNSLHGIGQWRQKTVQDRTSLLRQKASQIAHVVGSPGWPVFPCCALSLFALFRFPVLRELFGSILPV